MTTQALSKESQKAIQYFQDKLTFETGPVGLFMSLKEGRPLQLIDLRKRELYDQAHIPGALHILYEELPSQLAKLDKERQTVVYCYDILCNLSAKAALLLAENGFSVKELAGGFDEYAKKGFPIESKNQETPQTQGVSSCSSSGKHSCG